MVASSVTVLAPASGILLSNEIVRPQIYVIWAGGTGPFDVEYTWDDDPTFANGNGRRQQVTNVSVTSPDTAVPTADLGLVTDGTTWYFRATVIDQGDAGASLSDSDGSFTYDDPQLANRYLYLLANVGFGFTPEDDPAGGWGTGGTVGPDGDTIDFNRFLYLLAHVGYGFSTDAPAGGWGTGGTVAPDGDTRDSFARFLYLLANVDTTQPCPFIFGLSSTQVETGAAITVTGQGLVSATSPTADAWGAEVRLYATQDLGGSYVTLSISDWTAGELQDTITATVPGGASSGFVAVVHTAGTPSCAGSNFQALTVIAKNPDRQAGWWAEVWDLRNNTRVVTPLPDVAEADFEHIANDIGRGSITLPRDHPDIPDIIDRSTSPEVQRLVKLYLHDRFAYAFIPQDITEGYDDDGAARARLYGEGQEGILRWGRVLWKDSGMGSPTTAPTWKYGSLDDAIDWGDIDPDSAITNGGAEDAQVQPWAPEGTATLFADSATQRTGQYSLRVTPAALNDGALAEFGCVAGQQAFLDVYLRDPAALGGTYVVDVLDDSPAVVATDTVVLTSANWVKVTLSWVAATGYTATLRIRQTVGTLTDFYIDDAAAYTSIGVEVDGSSPVIETARATVGLSRDYVAGGLHSMKVAANAGGDVTFNGFTAFFDVTPNEDYTLGLFVTGPVGASVTVGLRLGGVLTQATQVLTGLGTFDKINVAGTAGPTETTGRFSFASDEAAATDYWLDELTVQPGVPASPAGTVLVDVITAMQARGTLPFLTYSFTATTDSNANPWPEVLRVELQPEWTLWDVCEKIIGLGYDVELVPQNWRAGGDSGWVLNVYNPAGAGVDWSTDPEGPAVLPGDTVAAAKPSQAPPPTTVVYAEGVDGQWTNVAASAARLTSLERREAFIRNRAAVDAVTLFRAADHTLTLSLTRGAQFTADLTDDANPLPYLDFVPYDRLRAHLPTDGSRDQVTDNVYRVAAITARLTAGGRGQQYDIDFGRYQLHAQRVRDQLLARMLLREPTELYQPGGGSVSTGR